MKTLKNMVLVLLACGVTAASAEDLVENTQTVAAPVEQVEHNVSADVASVLPAEEEEVAKKAPAQAEQSLTDQLDQQFPVGNADSDGLDPELENLLKSLETEAPDAQ
jgi:hypothetical protein